MYQSILWTVALRDPISICREWNRVNQLTRLLATKKKTTLTNQSVSST